MLLKVIFAIQVVELMVIVEFVMMDGEGFGMTQILALVLTMCIPTGREIWRIYGYINGNVP
jgi:hypothetical protein